MFILTDESRLQPYILHKFLQSVWTCPMRILNRTLVSETIASSALIALATTGIFIVIKVVELLKQAVEGRLPTDGLWILLVLHLINYMDIVVGAAVYIAVLVVLVRWNREQMMVIYATSGVGPTGFLIPAGVIALMATCVVGYFSFAMSPYANRMIQQELELFRSQVDLMPVEQGQFAVSGNGRSVVYFASNSSDDLSSIQYFSVVYKDDATEVTTARSGRIEANREWGGETLHLAAGKRYLLSQDSTSYETTEFDTLVAQFRAPLSSQSSLNTRGKPTADLIASQNPEDQIELIWRCSRTVMIFIVVLLAFGLNLSPTRLGAGARLVGAIVIYFVYSNLLGFVLKSGDGTPFESVILLGLVHGAFIALLIWSVVRTSRNKSFFPRATVVRS